MNFECRESQELRDEILARTLDIFVGPGSEEEWYGSSWNRGVDILCLQSQMEPKNCLEETTNSENPLQGVNNLQGVKISEQNVKANWKGFNRRQQKMTLKPEMTSGSIQGAFIYRHHIEPRVQLRAEKKKTFRIPLKYIDVTRATHTNLDVSQEKRIDECWNLDINRSLSESWKGFTKFVLFKEKPPKGYLWSAGVSRPPDQPFALGVYEKKGSLRHQFRETSTRHKTEGAQALGLGGSI